MGKNANKYFMTTPTRTLQILGTADPSTIGRVVVNDVCVHDGEFISDTLFAFKTTVTTHGRAVIDIAINTGSIKIENIIVTYPAIINKSIKGFMTFPQPIKTPMVQNLGDRIVTLQNVIVDKHIEYDHLMYNGPSYWDIEVDSVELYEGINIDARTVKLLSVDAVFNYDYKKFDVTSDDDFKKLVGYTYQKKEWSNDL